MSAARSTRFVEAIMRSALAVWPLALVAGCAQVRAMAHGLYEAIVHNSGAPPRAEIARMEKRQETFLRELPRTRLVIAPINVFGRTKGADATGAARIADSLRVAGLGTPTVASQAIVLPFQPQPNEAMIFWSRFKALADTVRAHPATDADYVLMVDVFGVSPERRNLGAVHAVVVTANGDMVYRGAWNSMQALYKEFKPATVEDAARMVSTDITRRARDTR
jgi:hypothetical protein